MKLRLTVFALFFLTNALGQDSKFDIELKSSPKQVAKDKLPQFIDSLKAAVVNDTGKFDRADLTHSAIGTTNKHRYSKLYIINGRYLYKLDIINPSQVLEFVNEYLDPSKIERLSITDTVYSQALYGLNGIPGIVSIELKRRTKFDPKIAGLSMNGKTGDNFSQKAPGELLLRE